MSMPGETAGTGIALAHLSIAVYKGGLGLSYRGEEGSPYSQRRHGLYSPVPAVIPGQARNDEKGVSYFITVPQRERDHA